MNNVKAEVVDLLKDASKETLGLIRSMEGSFYITGYQKSEDKRGKFETLFCKPTRAIAAALFMDREVLAVVANYPSIDARVLRYAKAVIREQSPRLDPGLLLVMHSDFRGNPKLRLWGREDGILVIPFLNKSEDNLNPDDFKRQISVDLFSMDPFDVTGPVSSDEDFYGRRSEALEIVRQLEKGRIRAFFGIRKVGKTSIINRVIQESKRINNTKIAMIDCSNDKVFSLSAEKLLELVGRTIRVACEKGYSTAKDITGDELVDVPQVFAQLPSLLNNDTLAIIFDEVDYITPGSPTEKHWVNEFNLFWRNMRVYVQEAQRQQINVSVQPHNFGV